MRLATETAMTQRSKLEPLKYKNCLLLVFYAMEAVAKNIPNTFLPS
jgi:hypothetical protein